GFGYEWHLDAQYDGGHPKRYIATGKLFGNDPTPWNVTAFGILGHGSGSVELHAVNPNPDGCVTYVDSLVYIGNAVWDGSVSFTGSGTWTSYCSGSQFNSGTWNAS